MRPKSLKFFDKFGITIPCSDTYFPEVGAHLSLKVGPKGFVIGKNTENLDF